MLSIASAYPAERKPVSNRLTVVPFGSVAIEILLFQKPIHNALGADSGIGIKYRPPLSDNIVITAGFNAFFPFRGFRDIYTSQTLYSLFTNVRFMF